MKNKNIFSKEILVAGIISFVKDLQRGYLKTGNVEETTYEVRIESYNKRLSEIDEELATSEANKEIKASRRIKEMFNVQKLLNKEFD